MELLSADPGLIVWTIVTFVLLLGILWKFAWNPILGALDARERAIQSTIEDAERLRAESEKVLEEHKKRLAEARQEGNRVLDEARQAGERMKQDIVEKAREEGTQMVARAERQIQLETEEAVQKIRAQAADLALLAAERVLGRALNEADHRRLADDAVAELIGERR